MKKGEPTQNNETAAPGSDPNADGSQSSGKLQRSSVAAVDANLGTTGIHTSGQVEPEIVERGTDALVVTSASLSPPPPDGSTHDAAHDASQEAGRVSNGETGQDETPRGPKPRGQISVETDLERGIGVIQSEVRSLPSSPGVYRMLDSRGDVLYVGKARNLKRRVANYAQVARLPYRLSRMVAETVSMEVVHTHTEVEALLLESNFIKRYMPRFNVLLRDDKSFPFIKLTRDHDYPQIAKHRGARSAQAEYFGPFASAGAVNRAITTLQRAFLLRNCTDSTFASRSRPCLQYQIKRCSAPCVGYIEEGEYEALVGQAKAFLAGKTRDVQTDLAAKMQTAAEELDFETAARLRDRIRALSFVQQHQEINVEGIEDADVIAAHTAGGKTCVEVFFFRSGRNYGNRSYFPSHDKSVDTADVLAAFLIQFYENKPPPRLILLSHDVPERGLIAEALTLRTSPSDREGGVGAGQTKKPSMRTARVEIAVPQRGEKRKLVDNAVSNAREALERRLVESASQRDLLHGVARVFGLEGAPARIEVYDNSHNQGTDAYGAMIVAGPEGMLKSAYRKFAIKGDMTGGDDYAMMQEVMRRRFSRALKEDPDRSGGTWPDLVLIDGGKGQLSAVRETLQELGVDDIPTVAIAKGLDRDAGRERFFMPGREVFTLDHRDPVLYFLQRLRDESHRFVIGTHRAKKIKTAGVSLLDEVPGIGAKRKKALLLHFGSARSVARAGLADLEKVEGINRTVAQKIYDHFHSEA